MVVKEAQLNSSNVNHVLAGHNPIVEVREQASKYAVRPGTKQQTLAVSRGWRTTFTLHSSEIFQRTHEEQIIPAAHVQDRHIDFAIELFRRDGLPVRVIGRV